MSQTIVVPLERCTDLSLVGGKAYGLARLVEAGLPVPPGCCLTTAAYQHMLDKIGFLSAVRWEEANRLAGENRRQFLTECRTMILAADVSECAESCVEALCALQQDSEPRWAVRSSGTNEDVSQTSCAGLYRTELAVRTDDIGGAIKKVWASIWEDHVVELLQRSGASREVPAMAVVIQPMCEA